MTTLIIARHGNTFGPEDTPTRVGGRTDLPLVEKGEEQARAVGQYLKQNNMIPDVVYASHLQRTIQTAKIAIKETGITNPVYSLNIFDEIDYGPDENQTEDTVIARIGAQAIKSWDDQAIVPDGWQVDPDQIIENWTGFADQVLRSSQGEVTLVVTSNGIARFAPYITGDFETFRQTHTIKLATGALGILEHDGTHWHVRNWNIKPDKA